MKVVGFISKAIQNFKNSIKEKIVDNNSIMEDITLINIKRISYVSIIAMIVNITSILVIILNTQVGNQNEMKWRSGIIMCHSILFLLMACLGRFCFLLSKKEKVNWQMRLIQSSVNIIIIVFGGIIVFIDQLVTTNITPFLIACTITSAMFLMRPIFSFTIFFSAYAMFYFFIGLTQVNEVVVLSDRINGLTAVSAGFCLSIILWSTNKANILQRRVILNQQKEMEENNIKLQTLAFYDSLTGLYSRRKFEELLQAEIYNVFHQAHESCLIILDIDYFKEINDNYGHPAGDSIIKQMASLLRKNVRKTDVVARWGGDEFLILLPQTSRSEGASIAEKLRNTMELNNFFIKEKELQLTASFGVAGLKFGLNDTLELAYKDADKALYTAKEKGRNRVVTA